MAILHDSLAAGDRDDAIRIDIVTFGKNGQGRVRIPDPTKGIQPIRGAVVAALTLEVEGDGGISCIAHRFAEFWTVNLLHVGIVTHQNDPGSRRISRRIRQIEVPRELRSFTIERDLFFRT
ncbi:MAG: hypothetical protein CL569_06880 [Alphaproteobacteria bacterium]|nr:hypothetical protein [Alphaproteobacteria bacterium]